MRKSTKKEKVALLKSHDDQSHNLDSLLPDERIIALVKFLAHQAAQQDYKSHAASQTDHHDKNGK